MIEEYLRGYNEDLEAARAIWLRYDLPAADAARLEEMLNPSSLGLPRFVDEDEAKRAYRQLAQIGQRLGRRDFGLAVLENTLKTGEAVGTAAGIVAGGGAIYTAAKTGGRWAVVKVVVGGAASFGVGAITDYVLNRAGASEYAMRGAKLAAAVVSLILLHKSSKRSGGAPTTTTATEEQTATGTALVPKAPYELGKWGEARLANDLGYQGFKPSKGFKTSLGKRFVDRLVAHEAKAGINQGLTADIRTQVEKDAELIATGRLDGAVWHFYQGATQELLDFLTKNAIKYVVH
jgi:hypothetical protein